MALLTTTAPLVVCSARVPQAARSARVVAARAIPAARIQAQPARFVGFLPQTLSGFAASKFHTQSPRLVEIKTIVRAEEGDAEAAPGSPQPIKLYVGNLDWGVDKDSLFEVFEPFNPASYEVVYERDTGRSRGFGFVTVPTQEDADRAVSSLDGSELMGRPLRVNLSLAPELRPQRQQRTYEADDRKVYVGNLSWGMDAQSLGDLCSEFGEVLDSRVITDRETGRSRGFGFVTMNSEDEARILVEGLNGQEVEGRYLKVNVASGGGR